MFQKYDVSLLYHVSCLAGLYINCFTAQILPLCNIVISSFCDDDWDEG
jgi:hypothetical protein